MSHIIVVFPRRDNAVNIRNVLVRAGMEVSAVCLTGAKVLPSNRRHEPHPRRS